EIDHGVVNALLSVIGAKNESCLPPLAPDRGGGRILALEYNDNFEQFFAGQGSRSFCRFNPGGVTSVYFFSIRPTRPGRNHHGQTSGWVNYCINAGDNPGSAIAGHPGPRSRRYFTGCCEERLGGTARRSFCEDEKCRAAAHFYGD